MNEVDVEYVAALLSIAEKCTGHSGKLSILQSWAIWELIRINDEIKASAVAHAAAEAQQKATGLPAMPGEEIEEDVEPDEEPTKPAGRRF